LLIEKNTDLEKIIGKSYGEFIRNLKKREIRYFLWEERYWPEGTFEFIKKYSSRDFTELGIWNHPDTGQMILFLVM